MTPTHDDTARAIIAALDRREDTFDLWPDDPQEQREVIGRLIPVMEQDAAAKRRDHKRDLRRRLPEDARPLVTIPDAIDRVIHRMMQGGYPTSAQRLISVDDCQELASYAAVLRGIAERLAEKE